MKASLFHNRICKVCALVAATLILPALAYADNNQGDRGSGINLGVPNGTYAFQDSGYVPAIPLQPDWFPFRRPARRLSLPTGK